ncbi:MAG: prolipoprotein diacylglyceryl transferase [Candidatus Riflebacteria bacterium]|nr:prolipoprotein diacylglyceryl transferase [Candidatus Riflebacteria bacterium]
MTLNLPNIWISVGNAVFLFSVYFYLKNKISKEHILASSLLAMFVALFTGRLFFAFINNTSYFTAMNILKSNEGGYSVLGAIAGAFCVFFAYTKFFKLPTKEIVSKVVPSWCAAQMFWRMNCLCSGCCFGRTTENLFIKRLSSLLGVQNPDLIPLPFFEILLMAVLFLLLGPLKPTKLKDVYVFWIFLFVYLSYRGAVWQLL